MSGLSAPTQAKIDAALAQSRHIARMDVGPGAVARAGAIFRDQFDTQAALVVADENTFAAAGTALVRSLGAARINVRCHIWPAAPQPKPSRESGDAIAGMVAGGETLVALGSGVINDLVKYAAFTRDAPYLCVATAVSMDGYTSAGAPLTEAGFKKTLACRPPRAIIADLDVLAAAPKPMTGWGFADLAGKVPAGADWILADAAGVEPIEPRSWGLVQDDLGTWLKGAARVGAGDAGALAELFGGLSMVGFAMEAHGSSRPASGADHQIAHLWEMEGLSLDGQPVSHGACVAIGSWAVLRLYDWLLQQDLTRLDIDMLVSTATSVEGMAAEIGHLFPDPEIAARALAETRAKPGGGAALRERLARLVKAWPALRNRLRAQVIPAEDFNALLRAAGAPSTPAEIGVTGDGLRHKARAARYFRNRYTILDMLADIGLLERAMGEVFGEEVD